MIVFHVAKIYFFDFLEASKAPLRYGVVALQERLMSAFCIALVLFQYLCTSCFMMNI